VQSRAAVPAMALGQLIGVLVAESRRQAAFGARDEAVLRTAATLVAGAIEGLRGPDVEADTTPTPSIAGPERAAPVTRSATTIRYFALDASLFVDGEYLIKGVAGRILWSLLRQHAADGRVDFTNRELRLDPTLELPGFKDNLESRLILLKRRLDERGVPMRIEKTGRGRFRLHVDAPLALDAVDA
jgi:hypothetical protein